jgi:site-specific recombinase XerD
MIREAVRDKTYELTPLGEDVALYLRYKRHRISPLTYESYEAPLSRLALYFSDLKLEDFEPPVGTERIEEWLDHFWGDRSRGTYNRVLSVVREFFKHWRLRERMHGDPMLVIKPAKVPQFHREVFSESAVRAILAAQESRRDRIALRLLLDYGRRKGELQAVQFKHFDYSRRQLAAFGKGSKVHTVPIPDPAFWTDLERHVLDVQARPADFLMCRVLGRWRTPTPEIAMGNHGLHDWFKERLRDAGIDPKGERMHKCRHTAGQRLFDATGDVLAAQALLNHTTVQTTADIYLRPNEKVLVAGLKKVVLR